MKREATGMTDLQRLLIDSPSPRFRPAGSYGLREVRMLTEEDMLLDDWPLLESRPEPTDAEIEARTRAKIPSPEPTDEEAKRLPIEPHTPGMVRRRALPGVGGLYWDHSHFCRSVGPDDK